ncbi:MAG: M50 family metallopeptidase [Deltaproteobacteria bacterium]|nr:M50 family metallopeptidase [Deltaproteobacteria bacterium]
MDRPGYLVLGRWKGAAIRVHLSAPLGALLFSGFDYRPLQWLGFLVLILAHEIGHATVARWAGAQVVSLDVHAIGGRCVYYDGFAGALARAFIASGGIAAQVGLWLLTLLVLDGPVDLRPTLGETGVKALQDFTVTNFLVAALNLLPLEPLDGAEIWKLPPLLAQRARSLVRRSLLKRRASALERAIRDPEQEDQGEDGPRLLH